MEEKEIDCNIKCDFALKGKGYKYLIRDTYFLSFFLMESPHKVVGPAEENRKSFTKVPELQTVW